MALPSSNLWSWRRWCESSSSDHLEKVVSFAPKGTEDRQLSLAAARILFDIAWHIGGPRDISGKRCALSSNRQKVLSRSPRRSPVLWPRSKEDLCAFDCTKLGCRGGPRAWEGASLTCVLIHSRALPLCLCGERHHESLESSWAEIPEL